MPKRIRPTKTKGEVDRALVAALAFKGYTDREIAELYGVSEQTINNWKKKYPVFFESLKDGKDLADSRVEASLYHRAVGYSHPEVVLTNYKGSVTKTTVLKHYPPDPTSMIFWLKNRKKAEWRDRQERSLTGADGEPIAFNIVASDKESAKEIAELRRQLTGESKNDRGVQPDTEGV